MTDPDDTLPDNERPTDPSPPPSADYRPGLEHARDLERIGWPPKLGDVQHFEVGKTLRFPEDAPPPDPAGTLTITKVNHDAGTITLQGFPEQPARDDERWQDAGRGPVKVGPNGDLVPATKAEAASRDWLDHGVDGSSSLGRARLRVKGLVDAYTPPPAPNLDDGAGPGGWRERHRKLKTAMAEHDQTTIGRIMAEPLDLLHSQAPAEVAPVDFDALETCIKLELAEWGRGARLRPGSVGFERRIDGVFAIRVVFSAIDSPLEARLTPRDLARAWKSANGNAREAAESLVRASAVELQRARAGERTVFTVPDVPTV